MNLLNNIQSTRNEVNNIININKKIGNYFKEPIKIGFSGHIGALLISFILWLVAFLLVVLILIYPLEMIFGEDLAQLIFNGLGLLLLLGTIIGYVYLYSATNKKIVESNIKADGNEEVVKLRQDRDKLLLSLSSNSIIPKDYWTIDALNTFEKYIINKRAEDLKECINLYEQESRHDEQMREISAMQQLQEATYRRASEATILSYMNLLFRR
ncbi:hypothetical protein K7887_20240 [Sutcliffiella horikoshii]|uniref:hypothetical protein n=1 Tax=Sutcliffiella horikoshii TaxID=79883 RepID=UPI001CBF089C|nr:hypothetical protein [Sutcliffiella horikoshii]UAL47151.1 hypothetical protein K7887_20240 [Sutcliffiella horikoshii]